MNPILAGGHPVLRGIRRGVCVTFAGVAVSMLAGNGVCAHADPVAGDARPAPYPQLRWFTQTDAEPYRLPDGQGVWFTTAQGLNCGIWFRGSFGCTGDIPGAPPNVHEIGWVTGDTRVHYDWTMSIRFPKSRGALSIPPLNYIESTGTTCATTVDGSTYCERGPWRMLITSTHTWLNG